mmetsp:Transcript_106890/g.307410  ORF Transcript_106890/g.307410 Transcript_106890/m.307410 type:complete len:256 (-) Transcript_106890:316-1083(-)
MKEVTIRYGLDSCGLSLYEGAEPASLNCAVDAFFNLGGVPFFLTLVGSPSVVPLSAALPPGVTLQLHLARPRGSTSPRLAQRAMSPAASSATPAAPVTLEMPMVGQAAGADATCPVSFEARSNFMAESMAKVAAATESIDRFSRLSTDMSNERTLLAWTRTGMAGLRTAFAYLAVVGTESSWEIPLGFARLAMISAVLVAVISGNMRYIAIKRLTFLPVPPQHFGRISMHWYETVLAMSLIAICCCMYANGVKKG